jgi:hypothetical protein
VVSSGKFHITRTWYQRSEFSSSFDIDGDVVCAVDNKSFALRRSRKIIRGLKEGLTEEERFAVADHTVAQLKQRGDPWRLNEEAPAAKLPST